MKIEGRIRGEVTASGLLWIGEAARIAGRVEAAEVVVAGEVDGELRASGRIELLGNQVLGADDAPKHAVARIKLLLQTVSKEFAPEQGLIRHMYLIRLGHSGRRESAHRIGSLLHELVVQGQASGEIRDDIEPGFVVHLLMSSFFHYVARWWHRDHDHVEEVDLTQVVDILMVGLQGERRMP